MDGIWNDEALKKLDLTVRIYKGELNAADGERIVSELNTLSARWISRRTDACQAYNRDTTISDPDHERLVGCLDTALGELEKKLARFADGDFSALDGVLRSVDECQP